jgi:hypothetical protein
MLRVRSAELPSDGWGPDELRRRRIAGTYEIVDLVVPWSSTPTASIHQ